MSNGGFNTTVWIEAPPAEIFPYSDVIGPGSRTVEIRLRPDGHGTLLELAHRDLPAEELPQHGIGWGHFLARLVVAATGADPGPDPWVRP